MERLICPSCGSRYEVPAELLAAPGAGPRKCRCRVCATVFLADTERQADTEAQAEAEGQEEAGAATGRASEAAPRLRPAVVAGVLLGLGLGASAGALGALVLHPDVAHRLAADTRLPSLVREAAARLPALDLGALGLPAVLRPATPLRFDVASRLDRLADGAAVLEVAGEIVNPGAVPAPVPALELRLVDAEGRTLERRRVQASATAIPGGGRVAFSTVAVGLPPGATGARLAAAGAVLDPR